jgi:hypothetical protein
VVLVLVWEPWEELLVLSKCLEEVLLNFLELKVAQVPVLVLVLALTPSLEWEAWEV